MSEVEEALSPIIIYCKLVAAYCSKSLYCKCYSLTLLTLNIFAICWPLPTFLQGTSFDFNKIIYLNNIVLSLVLVFRHAGNIYFVLCGQNGLETLFEVFSAQFKRLACGREKLRKLRRRQICLVIVPVLLKSALLFTEMTTYPYDVDNALTYLGIYFAVFMQTASDLLLGALANVTRILLEIINSQIEELMICADNEEIKRRFRKLRLIYEETCSTIPLTSCALQSLTVFSLPLGLFNSLNTAYYLILALWDLEQFYADYREITAITCVLWIASYFCQLAYYTLQCDNTTSELRQTANLLYKLEMCKHDESTKLEVYLFRQETHHFQKYQYTSYGFYNIGRTQIAIVATSLTSYLATLIQFHLLFAQIKLNSEER